MQCLFGYCGSSEGICIGALQCELSDRALEMRPASPELAESPPCMCELKHRALAPSRANSVKLIMQRVHMVPATSGRCC